MPDANILSLTAERLRDVLQQAGYRTEIMTDQAGARHLRSATNGLAFTVGFGNRLASVDETYVDATFVSVLQVDGQLPLDLVNRWNGARRFSRLHLGQGLLILEMDFSVVGGVSAEHLRAQVEIWDRLVQELFHYLRSELARLAAENTATVLPVAAA